MAAPGSRRLVNFSDKLEHLDELVELADRNAEDVGGARAADQIDEAIGDHLLFLRVPFLALAVDINPDAQPVFIGERAVGDLDRNLPVFLLPLLDEHA